MQRGCEDCEGRPLRVVLLGPAWGVPHAWLGSPAPLGPLGPSLPCSSCILCALVPPLRSVGPRQEGGLSKHLGSIPVSRWNLHTGSGRSGAPRLDPACFCLRPLGPLRMTILPRITDTNRQADNRGARWLPITDTGKDTGPLGGRTQGHSRGGGGGGEGQVQGTGAAEALLPRGGTDQGTFLVP